ncbi:MAG: hypothetical protein WCT02_01635 [Candidatus Paceibacterota bacterium]
MRDYQMVSPSLEGVLSHDSLVYEGLKRPLELLRVLDGPASKSFPKSEGSRKESSRTDRKVLEEYFHDLYGVFMKKLSFFIVEPDPVADETVKLQAMLQEMIKVKKLLGTSHLSF